VIGGGVDVMIRRVAVVMIPVCLARTVMFDVASFSVVSIFLA
jgi:hypothetical protein